MLREWSQFDTNPPAPRLDRYGSHDPPLVDAFELNTLVTPTPRSAEKKAIDPPPADDSVKHPAIDPAIRTLVDARTDIAVQTATDNSLASSSAAEDHPMIDPDLAAIRSGSEPIIGAAAWADCVNAPMITPGGGLNPGTVRILLIEDDPIDIEFLTRMLKMCPKPHFEIDVRNSLAEGLSLLGSEQFDVTLIDLDLPDSTGIESVQEIRLFDATIPIVVLTGLQDEELAMHAIEIGAQDFLSKINLTLLALVRSLRFSIARQLKFLGLQASADQDPLTGLPNRRGLKMRYQSISHRCRVRGEPLLLAIFDIDHFKKINDRYGHFVGDVVLQTFADRIRLMIEKHWWACRFGGEEFVVVMPKTTVESGQTLVNEWMQRMTSSDIRVGDAAMTVTASGGMVLAESHEGFDEAYVRCDQALYNAKTAGRNRLIVGPRDIAS